MHRQQESEVTRTGSETTYKPERKFSLDVFTFMEMPTLLAYTVICYYTNQLLIIRIDGCFASTNRMIGSIVSMVRHDEIYRSILYRRVYRAEYR